MPGDPALAELEPRAENPCWCDGPWADLEPADRPDLLAREHSVGAEGCRYHLAPTKAEPRDWLWPNGGRPVCYRCHAAPVYLAGPCGPCYARQGREQIGGQS